MDSHDLFSIELSKHKWMEFNAIPLILLILLGWYLIKMATFLSLDHNMNRRQRNTSHGKRPFPLLTQWPNLGDNCSISLWLGQQSAHHMFMSITLDPIATPRTHPQPHLAPCEPKAFLQPVRFGFKAIRFIAVIAIDSLAPVNVRPYPLTPLDWRRPCPNCCQLN